MNDVSKSLIKIVGFAKNTGQMKRAMKNAHVFLET